jgi:hypothetical protein
MNTETKTKRNGIKWVKITHQARNVYVVAFGFKGEIKAFKVQSGSKIWAQIAAKNWLDDQ